MYKIKKSDLFLNQLAEFAQSYKGVAGLKIAETFLDQVEDAIRFIGERPLSCAVYHEASGLEALRSYEYRKWGLKNFPVSLFFRILNDETVLLEAVYAHKMDIVKRLPSDMETGEG